jgi:hypothetical protein
MVGDNHLFLIKRGNINSTKQLPIWKFTGVGLELLPLIQKPLDEQYLEKVGKFFLFQKGDPAIRKITKRLPNN